MTYKIDETYRQTPYGTRVLVKKRNIISGNSPRVNGALKLQANTMVHESGELISWSEGQASENKGLASMNSLAGIRSVFDWKHAEAVAREEAYRRFRGKLYKDSASLGITLAQVGESRRMIESRSASLRSQTIHLNEVLNSSKSKVSRFAADNVIETIFGWQPLVTDIHHAATSVIQLADVLEKVSAGGQFVIDKTIHHKTPIYEESYRVTGPIRTRFTADIRIENPNKWLRERAGLNNVAAIAWDAVPWSFLANAFTNLGTIVNSLTDFSGLGLMNSTYTLKYVDIQTTDHTIWYGRSDGVSQSLSTFTYKQRELMLPSLTPRRILLRTPEPTLSGCAIAASLVIQNAARFVRIVDRVPALHDAKLRFVKKMRHG